MINTAALTGAGLATSKNPTLQQLYAAVQQYNSLPPGPGNAQAIRVLDKVMKRAAIYLTSKPPQLNKAKNKLRWDSMKELANSAAGEAKARGVKLLSSPADFREIKGNPNLGAQSYWLERVDPLHRPGYVLSAKYEAWVNTPDTFARKKSFWDAIGNEGSEDSVVMIKGDDGDGVPLVECYRITFNASGIALNALDQVFTTKDLSTVHSGAGWAVFVCSPAGELYARSHELGYFHHSSFLAGKPVAAAGELLVDEGGIIRIITAKTGHYRAGVDEMKQLVQLVPQIPGSTFILPEFIKMSPPPKGENKALLYRCDEFRARGTAAPYRAQSEVSAAIPHWANTTPSVRAIINKAPVSRPLDPSAATFVPRARPLNPNAAPFVPGRA